MIYPASLHAAPTNWLVMMESERLRNEQDSLSAEGAMAPRQTSLDNQPVCVEQEDANMVVVSHEAPPSSLSGEHSVVSAGAVPMAKDSHGAFPSVVSHKPALTSEMSVITINNDEEDQPTPVAGGAELHKEHQAMVKSALATSPRAGAETRHEHHTKRKLGEVIHPEEDSKPVAKKQRRVSSSSKQGSPTKTLLLAQDSDDQVLNPIHVFVRKQVEVFAATEEEIQQPAPGRKNPIQLKQIGLRCIHCKHLPSRERVKRAVCYPTSVGRVYHSISDMKHDHFGRCKGLVGEAREEFERLKSQTRQKKERKPKYAASKHSGCSSSTAQYYHDSALKMGMADFKGGVFFADDVPQGETRTTASNQPEAMSQQPAAEAESPTAVLHGAAMQQLGMGLLGGGGSTNDTALSHLSQLSLPQHLASGLLLQQGFYQQMLQQQLILSSLVASQAKEQATASPTAVATAAASATEAGPSETVSVEAVPVPASVPTPTKASVPEPAATPDASTSGVLLSSSDDSKYLNPIHCFVRRNVEVFAANEEDVAAPAPGRKTRITLGQVGLRCIHCAPLPVKDRVKRAFCYPPSVNGIYHAVSNMKFDHFQLCKGLPGDRKAEFVQLRSSCKRRGSSAMGKGTSNSTAQYYHDSALSIGLVDTDEGIRFKKSLMGETAEAAKPNIDDKKVTEAKAQGSAVNTGTFSKSFAKDGISALVIAAASDTQSGCDETLKRDDSKMAVI